MPKKLAGRGGPGRGQGRKNKFGTGPAARIVAYVSPARKKWISQQGRETDAVNAALDRAGVPR